MPRNPKIEATKSKMKSKSTTRRPLKDVSNAKNAVKCSDFSTKNSGENCDDSLDRLLLVHSDLSEMLKQVDELVVQALQLTSKKGKMEIKRFADVLSEMQTTLKPWVPKFQKALSSESAASENESKQPMETPVVCIRKENTSDVIESPEQTKWESLISPSPLVSWRAGCNPEGGRQLFLLTPLPRKMASSSKCRATPAPAVEKIISDENSGLDIEAAKTECTSPEKLSRTNCPMFVMTPCFKMSPPKSCILLEPVSEFFTKKNQGLVHKSTPFPVRNSTDLYESESSSSEEASDDLNVKYPELYGLKPAHAFGNKMKVVEEDSPNWMVSPPKTCAIMEPTDELSLTNIPGSCLPPPKTAAVDNQGDLGTATKTYLQQDISGVGKLNIAESTPMVSVFRTGKHPGETTLKRELWTRFEAASTHSICFEDSTIPQKTSGNGFLDRLEEASDI